MEYDWKPGDVASVSYGGRGGAIAIVRPRKESLGQDLEFAYIQGGFDMVESNDEERDARPLVVIDPEDREQTAALTKALVAARLDSVIDIHAAITRILREFANPPQPKPEEPTGLGAVVEDEQGRIWTRLGGDPAWGSYDPPMDVHDIGHYEDIAAVRVLSEGVSA